MRRDRVVDGPPGSFHPLAAPGSPATEETVTQPTTPMHEMSYQLIAGARHRAIGAWCGTSTFAVKPNTKHQRLKEPSPG